MMKNLRSCMTILGAGAILFGVLLLLAVLFGYNDPTGVSNRLGANLLILTIFLVGFFGVGAGLIYAAMKLKQPDGG